MKFVDLKTLPQNQYLSKFLAAKYLQMPIFEFDKMVTHYNIKTYKVDKFGDKYKVADLVTVIEAIQKGTPVPKKVTEAPQEEIPTKNDSSQRLVALSIVIQDVIAVDGNYVSVPRKQITLYEKVPLYHKNKEGKFVLYKPENTRLPEERIDDYRCPALFFHDKDREEAMAEVINRYNELLNQCLEKKDMIAAQKLMVDIFNNAISNPEVQTLLKLRETVAMIVKNYNSEVNVLDLMCNTIGLGKGVSEHAVNIMNLAIKFCINNEYSYEDSVDIALSALLHDIGKTKLKFPGANKSGFVADTEENRKIYEAHCLVGAQLIDECHFANEAIRYGALEHHETIDGSGFPEGKHKLTFYGQLIGMIHFFEDEMEMLSKEVQQVKPLTILKKLKEEVDHGRYNGQLFKQFAYSLL